MEDPREHPRSGYNLPMSKPTGKIAPIPDHVAAIPATLGFVLFFDVRKGLLAQATLGGFLTEGIYLLGTTMVDNAFVPCLAASVFAALYAEALALIFRTPTSVFFIISVIPLIPGRVLFYAMKYAVQVHWVECAEFALLTFQYVAAIAIGITVVWTCVQTWQNWRDERSADRQVPVDATDAPDGK